MARRGKKRNKKNRLRFITIFMIIIMSILVGGTAGMILAVVTNTERLDQLEYRPSLTTFIYDANGTIITRLYAENRIPVSISQIPQYVLDALVATEDNRFYDHYGVDLRAILRALWIDIRHGDIIQGGSTITQQLAKCAFLTADRTLWRKIQDAVLAIQLERKYTKREILELYLNEIYFGPNANGIEAASQAYFGKHVWELDLAESALIVGIIRSPGRYSPYDKPGMAKARRDLVLDNMVRYGYISEQEAKAAKSQPIKVIELKRPTTKASYFVSYIKEELIEKYGESLLYRGGLKIYTTLDLNMQEIAERELFATLPVNSNNEPQGALIAIEPNTGYIRAMVGGRGGDDHFNRATKALRQPGSTIKPLYYAAAIETRRFTTATIIDDSPVQYSTSLSSSAPWSPSNYDGTFRGPVTLREALINSINVPSVKLLDSLGIDIALKTIKNLGISTLVETGTANDRNLASLGLGGLTRGISPIQLAAAYSAFANQGVKIEPIGILKVVDENGMILEEKQPRRTIVFSEETTYIITDMLKDVIRTGTGRRAKINRNEAGKTGTSNDFTNAWFVGYTPDLLSVVWLGNNSQNQPMEFGNTRIGSGETAQIWSRFMSAALKDKPIVDFPMPKNLVRRKVCQDSGLIPNEYCSTIKEDLFVKGTEPKGICEIHKQIIEVKICTTSNALANENCPEDAVIIKRYQRDSGIEVDEQGLPKKNGTEKPTQYCDVHVKKTRSIFPFLFPSW